MWLKLDFILLHFTWSWFPWWLRLQRICLPLCRRPRFDPWGRKILWRREWLPTPVFLPGEFHEQRSLVGYSPWGHKESDMTEWLTLSISLLYFNSHYIIFNIFDRLVLLVSICLFFFSFFSSLHFKFLVLIYFKIFILKLISPLYLNTIF